jgi:hypothetical protein
LINLNPSKANDSLTLDEFYTRKRPSVDHLRIYGCIAYVHVPKKKWNKLQGRTMICIFTGYDSQSKTNKCFDFKIHKIIMSKDMVFEERMFGMFEPHNNETPTGITIITTWIISSTSFANQIVEESTSEK